jgi:hypothetical protein
MLKTMRLISAAAVAALALPALAGSWPPTPPRKTTHKPAVAAAPAKASAASFPAGSFAPAPIEVWQLVQPAYAYENGRFVLLNAPAASAATARAQTAVFAGFEPAGGDAGWQLAQHKYDFVNGKLTMSDECDHAIRTAQAPTPTEVDSARRLSPGA